MNLIRMATLALLLFAGAPAAAHDVTGACAQMGKLMQDQLALTLSEISIVTEYAAIISAMGGDAGELAREMKKQYEVTLATRIDALSDGIAVVTTSCEG